MDNNKKQGNEFSLGITGGILGILVLLIIIVSATKAMPSHYLRYSGTQDEFAGEIAGVENAVKESIKGEYYNVADKIDIKVSDYLTNERGFDSNETWYSSPSEYWGSIEEAEASGGEWEWTGNGEGETKSGEVSIVMQPTLEEMKSIILAYIIAVNSTLENFTFEQRFYTQEMIEYNEANPDYANDMQRLADNFDPDDFVDAMELFKANVFTFNPDPNSWIDQVEMGDIERTYTRTVTESCSKDDYVESECGPKEYSEIDNSVVSYGSRTYDEEVTEIIQGPKGTIYVAMQYNLLAYRYGELNSVVEWYINPPIETPEFCVSGGGTWENDSCSYGYSVEDVWEVLYDQMGLYFNDYCTRFHVDTTADWFVANEMFGDFLAGIGGEIKYGDFIDSPNFAYGDWSFDLYGEIHYGQPGFAEVWGHLKTILTNNGKTVGIGQCTGFVWSRVYDQTGLNIPMPNGNQMARALADEYPDLYELSSKPAPGAVASCALFNHVFYVEAVSEDGIWVSDGNADFKGSLRINHFYSWDNWYKNTMSKALYAVPTE